jgi:hypothetical protein
MATKTKKGVKTPSVPPIAGVQAEVTVPGSAATAPEVTTAVPRIVVDPPKVATKRFGDDFFDRIASNDASQLDAYTGNIHVRRPTGHTGLCVAAVHRLNVSLMWCIRHGVGRTYDSWPFACDYFTRIPALISACYLENPGDTNPKRDDPECAKLLVHAGADPRAVDSKNGLPALAYAAQDGLVNIARFLAPLAWDFPGLLDVKGNKGQTALDIALRRNQTGIVEIIQGVQVRDLGTCVAHATCVIICNCSTSHCCFMLCCVDRLRYHCSEPFR